MCIFIFKVDADVKSGIGHIIRCLVLAVSLRKNNYKCFFIVNSNEKNIINLTERNGFQTYSINLNQNYINQNDYIDADIFATINILKKFDNNLCLIIDDYNLNYYWEKSISNFVKNIVVLEDIPNRKHFCGLLIDSSFSRVDTEYKQLVLPKTKILTGSKYILLRDEFLFYRKKYVNLDNIQFPPKKILMNFGGKDFLREIIDMLFELENSKLPDGVEIDLILGPLTNISQRLLDVKVKSRFFLEISNFVHNMPKKMLKSDLCIGAVGSSTWERMCLGRPSILTSISSNQLEGARNLEISGGIQLFDYKKPGDLISKIDQLDMCKIKKMSNFGMDLVDGKGYQRVIKHLLEGI